MAKKTVTVCHDMNGIRKVRRAALKQQAYLDRDYGNRSRKNGPNKKTLFQMYLESERSPLDYVQKREARHIKKGLKIRGAKK